MEEKNTGKESWSTPEDVKKEGTKRPQQTRFDWNTQQYPENFNFGLNPICEGTVTKVGSVNIRGRIAPFINVDTHEGEFTVWAGIVLSSAIEEEHIEKGDIIGIKYISEEVGNKGLTYKNYDVRVVKPAPGA